MDEAHIKMVTENAAALCERICVIGNSSDFTRNFFTMFKTTSRFMIATAVGLLSVCLAAPAQAAIFNFSYFDETNGDLLSGVLDGDVQSDGDIVQVSKIGPTTVNGNATEPITRIDSVSDLEGQIVGAPPVVSFSGQTMDLSASFSFGDGFGTGGFGFDSSGIFLDEPTYFRSPDFTEIITSGPVPFTAGNWSLVAQSNPPQGVPEPSLVIGMLGSIALLITSQKKQKQT